jgi:hypothetical protein
LLNEALAMRVADRERGLGISRSTRVGPFAREREPEDRGGDWMFSGREIIDTALFGVETLEAMVELEFSDDIVDDDVADPERDAAWVWL